MDGSNALSRECSSIKLYVSFIAIVSQDHRTGELFLFAAVSREVVLISLRYISGRLDIIGFKLNRCANSIVGWPLGAYATSLSILVCRSAVLESIQHDTS